MNSFPQKLEAGQRVEYVVTGLDPECASQLSTDPSKLFVQSSGGYRQVVLDLAVESDEGPVTRRHWITFNTEYPDIAKNQLKAIGWDGTNVSLLRGVGSKQCKLVGVPQKKDPTRINWNLYAMSKPITDEQRLNKADLLDLDATFSESKIPVASRPTAPPVRTAKF